MADLSCRGSELLAADVEMGRASSADRMRLEVHLQRCVGCAARTERLRGLAEILRREPVVVHASDRAIVAAALIGASSEQPRDATRRVPPVSLAIAAAALIAVSITAAWLATRDAAPIADRHERRPAVPERAPAPGPSAAPDERIEPREPERVVAEAPAAASPALATGRARPCEGVTTEAVAGAAAFVLRSEGRTCRLRLDTGEIRVHVDPRARVDFAIATPSADVRVVGTVFSVGVDAERRTSVVVLRGAVEVAAGDRSVRVRGGSEVAVAAPGAAAPSEVRAAPAPMLRTLRHLATHLEEAPGAAATATEATPAASTEAGSSPEAVAPIADLRQMIARGQPAEARARATERSARPEYAPRRAELLTIVAETYVMERDHRRAFDAYEEVWTTSPGTTTAANATLAAANLALDRLADPARARALYETYIREFPRAPLHETAVLGRCRALAAAGRAADAASCARAYLATHPDGRLRDQAERLLPRDDP